MARRSLPLPDELIENILARVASPRDLVFASVAHPDFHRIIAGASFPRLYRSLHPPQLLGILGPRGFAPAEAPHSNAPVARALAGDADFSSDHLPADHGRSRWLPSDARDGRVLLMRSGLSADSVVLQELAVYDPFTRGYKLLPPIPDSLVVASADPVSSVERVGNFQALFVPSGDYEDAHFRVLGWTYDDAVPVVFVYSSLSGTWAAGNAASWDALGLNVNLDIIEPEQWLPSYAYGCFYWQVPERNKLLKLNIEMMEFSAVGLPPNYANRWVVVVEAGEGRVGIFTRSYTPNIRRALQYSIRQNGSENTIEHSNEATIPMPTDCRRYIIVAAAEGYIFLQGIPSRGTPVSWFYTLEVKTLKVERGCSTPRHRLALPYLGYFGYPHFLSPRRI